MPLFWFSRWLYLIGWSFFNWQMMIIDLIFSSFGFLKVSIAKFIPVTCRTAGESWQVNSYKLYKSSNDSNLNLGQAKKNLKEDRKQTKVLNKNDKMRQSPLPYRYVMLYLVNWWDRQCVVWVDELRTQWYRKPHSVLIFCWNEIKVDCLNNYRTQPKLVDLQNLPEMS